MRPRRVLVTAAVLLTGYSGENTETDSETGTPDDSTVADSDAGDCVDGTNEISKKDKEAASPVIGVILMVGIAVILASIVGAFVLGAGGDIGQNEGATVELVQYSNRFSLTVVDVGDFEDARIVGPQGQTSMRLDETFDNGTKIIIHEKKFSNDPDEVDVQNNLDSSVEGAAGGNLVQDERCLIRHDEQTLYGVDVNESDIGCSGKYLEDAAESLGGETDFAENKIDFKLDAQYQLVISKGSSSRAKTFTIKDLK